jgi:DNA helicase-2/ATP-dependent DNA helicase PcrA
VSDSSVHAALRSEHPLVLVEAPAGCGKTYQGAAYARELLQSGGNGRPLILTHTHAACSVFSERTKGAGAKIEIRTIDSVIARIASAYHSGLGLPADTAAWVRQRRDQGYAELALMVSTLLKRHPMIASVLARRHPIVVCDEHQDSSGDQHSVVMALLEQGAKIRVFADPMQKIFGDKTLDGSCLPCDWNVLKTKAHAYEELDFPHRWKDGCPALGTWTLAARKALMSGNPLDLRTGRPEGLDVVFAENQALENLEYRLSSADRKPVDAFEQGQTSLLILTRHNQTARSFRGFFSRRILLWEGHTRTALETLVRAVPPDNGDSVATAAAVIKFLADVGKGFSPSAFGNRLVQEVREGCTRNSRGKPAAIQQLARCIVDDPSHRGVARMLGRLSELRKVDAAFADVEVDHYKEFYEAIQLGKFENPDVGLAEITHHRTYLRPRPPLKAISTIHKAKGLECDSVVVMPCDSKTFPNSAEARCLLYVALSRAKKRLMLVVSRENPSPLLVV